MNGGNGEEQVRVIDDDGPLRIEVSRLETKVLVRFDRPRSYFLMPANQAHTFAEQVARYAFEAHYGFPAPDGGSELSRQVKAKAVDEVRPRLIRRATHIMRSLLDKNRSLERISEEVVDAVLKEVT